MLICHLILRFVDFEGVGQSMPVPVGAASAKREPGQLAY